MKEIRVDNTDVPSFDLQKHHAKVELPTDIDLKEEVRRYCVFPLKVIKANGRRQLLLAMRNVKDQRAVYDVEFKAGMNVIPVQADDIDIQWLVQKHYYGRPLTPTPSNRTDEVTHDLFEQLTMTTDAQARPDWVNDSLQLYVEEGKKSSQS